MQRVLGGLVLLTCLFGLWIALQTQRSVLASSKALAENDPSDIGMALRLTPNSAEAHYLASILLAKRGQTAAAIDALQTAIVYRPTDYQLWLELGQLLAAQGNNASALEAFNQSVRFAPFYAQPRWHLGNVLLGLGQKEEAFEQLAVAGSSDPQLFLSVVQLAWKEYEGRPDQVERVVRPTTAHDRVSLGQFFVWRGLPDQALEIFRKAGEPTAKDRAYLITDLLAGKHFVQAYQVRIHGQKDMDESGLGVIEESGFETALSFIEEGFGWKFPRDAGAVSFSFDKSNPREGERSFRLDWKGNTNSSTPTLSQLVLVERDTKYRLHFSVRIHQLVSGTPPFIGVTDASINERMLGQVQLSVPEENWHNVSLEFTTSKTTNAVRIVVQRPRCSEPTCPIFGRVWLDNFSLEKIRHSSSDPQQ